MAFHFRIPGRPTQLSPEMYSLVHDVEDAAEDTPAAFIRLLSRTSGARAKLESRSPRALQFFDPDTGIALSGRSVAGSGGAQLSVRADMQASEPGRV